MNWGQVPHFNIQILDDAENQDLPKFNTKFNILQPVPAAAGDRHEQYANDQRHDSGLNLATECGDHDRIGLDSEPLPTYANRTAQAYSKDSD